MFNIHHSSVLVIGRRGPDPRRGRGYVDCHIKGAEYALFGSFARINVPNFLGAIMLGERVLSDSYFPDLQIRKNR